MRFAFYLCMKVVETMTPILAVFENVQGATHKTRAANGTFEEPCVEAFGLEFTLSSLSFEFPYASRCSIKSYIYIDISAQILNICDAMVVCTCFPLFFWGAS